MRLMWGHGAREQCGSNERCTGSIDSLKHLTTSLVWTGGAGGRRGGVGEEAGGGEGEPNNWSDLAGEGGGQGERAVVWVHFDPQKPKNWFDLAGDEGGGGGWGGGVGGGGPGRRRGSIKECGLRVN